MTFGFTDNELQSLGAIFTAKEIAQQPDIWLKTLDILEPQLEPLQRFIRQITFRERFDILMVGAGTSCYVGESVSSVLNERLPYRIRCCGSTDLVVEPEKYLSRETPTLLVSFARSGNSPESVGAVSVANQLCKNILHLFITCNKNGALAVQGEQRENCRTVVLPPETNDQGFAMTSSFSSMYLAALAAFQPDRLAEIRRSVELLCAIAKRLIQTDWKTLQSIVEAFDFQRVVYLGTGVLHGIAQESALKMLELNAGQVATLYESPLGFRHGPKSILNDETLTVFYLSSDPYVRRYELDLVRELSVQRQKNRLMTVSFHSEPELATLSDHCFIFHSEHELAQEYGAMLDILLAQILALLKSLRSQICPDNPCPTGEVNRVVKGVTIYPYTRS